MNQEFDNISIDVVTKSVYFGYFGTNLHAFSSTMVVQILNLNWSQNCDLGDWIISAFRDIR